MSAESELAQRLVDFDPGVAQAVLAHLHGELDDARPEVSRARERDEGLGQRERLRTLADELSQRLPAGP